MNYIEFKGSVIIPVAKICKVEIKLENNGCIIDIWFDVSNAYQIYYDSVDEAKKEYRRIKKIISNTN